MDFVLANEVPNSRCGDENLHRHDAARAARFGQERLAQDAFEHKGELGPNLRLLMGREDVDDAVDRLGRRVRMERREGQMARLRNTKRGFDSLEVTHLTDEHDVGIFTQCGA